MAESIKDSFFFMEFIDRKFSNDFLFLVQIFDSIENLYQSR